MTSFSDTSIKIFSCKHLPPKKSKKYHFSRNYPFFVDIVVFCCSCLSLLLFLLPIHLCYFLIYIFEMKTVPHGRIIIGKWHEILVVFFMGLEKLYESCPFCLLVNFFIFTPFNQLKPYLFYILFFNSFPYWIFPWMRGVNVCPTLCWYTLGANDRGIRDLRWSIFLIRSFLNWRPSLVSEFVKLLCTVLMFSFSCEIFFIFFLWWITSLTIYFVFCLPWNSFFSELLMGWISIWPFLIASGRSFARDIASRDYYVSPLLPSDTYPDFLTLRSTNWVFVGSDEYW